MTLKAGTHLRPCEILSRLGAGGYRCLHGLVG